MLTVLERRTRRTEAGAERYAPRSGPTAIERAAAGDAIAIVERELAAGFDVDRLRDEIRKINASLRQSEEGYDAVGAVQALREALAGRSGPAFYEACRRIRSDEAPPEFSRVFRPTVPQLVALTKLIEREWRAAADALHGRLAAAVEPAPGEGAPLTTEQRADLDRRIRALGGTKRRAWPLPEPSNGKSPAGRVGEQTSARRAARVAVGGLENLMGDPS